MRSALAAHSLVYALVCLLASNAAAQTDQEMDKLVERFKFDEYRKTFGS